MRSITARPVAGPSRSGGLCGVDGGGVGGFGDPGILGDLGGGGVGLGLQRAAG